MTTYNERMRATYSHRYTRETLPTELRGFSLGNVNTLLHLGWTEQATKALLTYAYATGNEPDWSEDDWDELRDHFISIEMLMGREGMPAR